ncbi:MAG: hypothetical protein FWE87_05645, partial [Coriobacteriia bacterium]|nr:hypothetical protein [Coriobacteriia bacterium]
MKLKRLKMVALIMCCAMVFSVLPIGTGVALAQGASVPWAQAYNKLSDPDTSNSSVVFDTTTMENGRLWVDKSVNADGAPIYDSDGSLNETIVPEPDEFMVTLSALSEAYAINAIFEPIDAVFIVDVSGSMTYGFEGDTEGATGERRIDALAEALNEAFTILMEANSENRVAVVAYGGESGRRPHSYPVLGLDRYSVPSGESFFSVSVQLGETYFDVNENIVAASGAVVPSTSIHVNGGTPTQRGIAAGAKILMDNNDKTYTDPASGVTVIRQPVMFLLTDGEPTFGWENYINPGTDQPDQDVGDAITPDMGIDILTVITASYWKKQVSEWYYGTINPIGAALFYTIGMYMINVHTNSVLDPQQYAYLNEKTYAGTTYNMESVLNDFITNGSATFPIINYFPYPTVANTALDSNYHLITLTNVDDYVTSYAYTDGYFQAEDANSLKEALQTITSQIIEPGDFITQVGVNDPNFSGYLTFSDVLGRYMEFKSYDSLWYNDQKFTGESFAQEFATNGMASADWTSFVATLAAQMEVPLADAETVLETSLVGGSLYYNGPSDWSNQIKWYADNDKNFVGPYFELDGTPAPVPAGAMCTMDLYPVEGMVESNVTDQYSSLTLVPFVVLTALQDGSFTDHDEGMFMLRQLVAGQQIVRFYVPAGMLPMRTVEPIEGPDYETIPQIKDSGPIRAVFAVGPVDSLSLYTVDDDYKAQFRIPDVGFPALLPFFTNQWDLDSNITVAFCEINPLNPYYYFVGPGDQVPLYVADGSGGYRLAVSTDTGPFFAKQEYFDLNAPGYIGVRYTPVDPSWVITGSGAPYIPTGTPRSEALNFTELKSDNITETLDYVVNSIETIIEAIDHPLQIRFLGNNGRFEIPITNIVVEKIWKDLTPVPVWIQLFMHIALGDAMVGPPIELNADNGWTYSWGDVPIYTMEPDAQGNVEVIEYTIGEEFEGDPPADWDISYVQPVWNAENNMWSVATVTNARKPSTPPP